MRRALLLLLLAAAAGGQVLAAPVADCASRPAWCQEGFECMPTSCAARGAAALEGLTSQLQAARAARPRWFRPFAEGGLTWSPTEQRYGVWAAGGVQIWRLQTSAEVTDRDVRIRAGWRKEW